MVRSSFRNWLILPVFLLLFSSCGVDWVPLDVDKTLGKQGQQQIMSGLGGDVEILKPEEHKIAYGRLEAMRNAILESGKLRHSKDFEWDLHIVKEDSVLNAFCLPGGHIYVYTGLIRYLDSESALAGVLGHEMAHADCRHSTNQLVKNLGISLLIQVILGFDHSTLANLGANLLSLSFSRSDETEADLKSVEYLYHTRYDARGAGKFFEKLEKENKTQGIPEFISTHPDPGNRQENITEKWKELGGKKGENNISSYKELVNDL